MQTHTQGKVDKGNTDDDLELVNENVDESGLEYIGVEEKEKYHNHGEHDTQILDTVTNKINL